MSRVVLNAKHVCVTPAKHVRVHRRAFGKRCRQTAVAQSGLVEAFTDSQFRDVFAMGISAFGSVLLVKTFDFLAMNGFIGQKSSRKLLHILAGPGFMLTWPLFSDSSMAPFLAACVPGINGIRLLLVGLGLWKQEGMVKSVSRSGDRSELLRGPLIYVCVLCAITALNWRSNPIGMMVIAMMCGGDGAADIIGRKFGSVKLPWSTKKSYAGSLAMFVGGALLGFGLLAYFSMLQYITASPATFIPSLIAISATCTIVEALPITNFIDDNLSVPLAAALLGYLVLPWALQIT